MGHEELQHLENPLHRFKELSASIIEKFRLEHALHGVYAPPDMTHMIDIKKSGNNTIFSYSDKEDNPWVYTFEQSANGMRLTEVKRQVSDDTGTFTTNVNINYSGNDIFSINSSQSYDTQTPQGVLRTQVDSLHHQLKITEEAIHFGMLPDYYIDESVQPLISQSIRPDDG